VLSLLFNHKVRLPGDIAMLIRAIMVLEGLGRSLDPNYRIVESLEPYIRRLIADKLSIRRLGMGAMRTVTSLSTLAQRLPSRLDDLWDQIDEGNLSIGVSVRELTYIIGKVDKIVNRIVFALIVVGLVIGSALILMVGDAVRTLFTIPFLDVSLPIAQIGFIAAGIAGVWLIWSVIRTRGL
jgi:ubiquinone biosynthesis protein